MKLLTVWDNEVETGQKRVTHLADFTCALCHKEVLLMTTPRNIQLLKRMDKYDLHVLCPDCTTENFVEEAHQHGLDSGCIVSLSDRRPVHPDYSKCLEHYERIRNQYDYDLAELQYHIHRLREMGVRRPTSHRPPSKQPWESKP